MLYIKSGMRKKIEADVDESGQLSEVLPINEIFCFNTLKKNLFLILLFPVVTTRKIFVKRI